MTDTDARPAEAARESLRRSVPAWDLPTRVFHWLLVVLLFSSWATFQFSESLRDPLLKWHRWCGLAVLTLLVWRLLWGMFGPSTARFANFVPAPGTLIGYARQTISGSEPKYLGHNPLGSLMILALLGLVLVQGTLGLFTVEHNDLTAGPLYRLVSEEARKAATAWHRWLFEAVTLWFIAVHIAANLFYALFRRDSLLTAMITGRKPAVRYADEQAARMLRWPIVTALALLALSAAIVYFGILALGGKFLAMSMRL